MTGWLGCVSTWGCQLVRPIDSQVFGLGLSVAQTHCQFQVYFWINVQEKLCFYIHMAYSAVTGHEINAGDIICLRKYAWSSLMIDVTAVIYGFKDPRQGGLGVSSTWGCQSIPIDSFGFIFGLLYRNNHFYVCLQS